MRSWHRTAVVQTKQQFVTRTHATGGGGWKEYMKRKVVATISATCMSMTIQGGILYILQ